MADARNVLDSIEITVRNAAGAGGSFRFDWHQFGFGSQGGSQGVQSCAFDDSWKALLTIAPILEELDTPSDKMPPTPEQFIKVLERYGFTPSQYHGEEQRRKAERPR